MEDWKLVDEVMENIRDYDLSQEEYLRLLTALNGAIVDEIAVVKEEVG